MWMIIVRIFHSLIYRCKLIWKISFCLDRNLPNFDVANKPDIEVIGNADVLRFFRVGDVWKTKLPRDYSQLTRKGEVNLMSIETDVGELLCGLVRWRSAKKVIEVGVYKGAGSVALARGLDSCVGGELHLVDIDEGLLAEVEKEIFEKYKKVKVTSYVGDSSVVGKRLKIKADLIFVDADHRYLAANRDARIYWKLLKKGGLLVLHDTVHLAGTRRVANEWNKRGIELITVASSGGSGVTIMKKK